MTTVTKSVAQYCDYDDTGFLIDVGWHMDKDTLDYGFTQSRATVGTYFCRGIGFVGPNVQFPSKSDNSFRLNLDGGINIHVPYVLFSPYVSVGYIHYKTNLGLPEVMVGYGCRVHVSVFGPVGIYGDVRKCHYLDQKYVPQKKGPFSLSVGVMVIIR